MSLSFYEMRLNARMSRNLCAYYFQVNLSTVSRWDTGTVKPPFSVLELLSVIAGNVPALSRHQVFDGWSFGEQFIFTPEGEKYSPEDIREIFYLRQQLQFMRGDIRKLEKEVQRLTPDKAAIMDSNVIKFPTFGNHQQKAKK